MKGQLRSFYKGHFLKVVAFYFTQTEVKMKVELLVSIGPSIKQVKNLISVALKLFKLITKI